MIAALLAVLALALGGCAETPAEIPDLAFHRGQNALNLGRSDWARRYFQQDLEANPKRLESLRGLGLAWVSGNDGSLARGTEALAAYLEQVPGDADVRLRLARLWLLLDDRRQALAVLEDAGESATACELRANALADDDPAAAERQVTAALAAEPGTAGALRLGARLAHQRGDGELALSRALASARADPLRPALFYLLAQIRRRLGDEEGAQRELEIYQQLRRLPVRGRPSELSPYEELQALRALEPHVATQAPPWRLRMARLMLTAGDADAEAAVAELIADPAGEAIDVLKLAGEAHGRGRTKLARDLYRHALELDPELKAARAQLARLEHETGDRDAALRLLAEGLEAHPYHAPYHFASGLLALGQGQEPAAIAAFETALDLAPWLASYRLALADVYRAAGRRDEHERLLEQAPADDPAITAYRKRYLG